jgi:hypothetical protein
VPFHRHSKFTTIKTTNIQNKTPKHHREKTIREVRRRYSQSRRGVMDSMGQTTTLTRSSHGRHLRHHVKTHIRNEVKRGDIVKYHSVEDMMKDLNA